MDWGNAFTYLISGTVISAVLAYLNRGAAIEVTENSDGFTTLHIHRLYLYLGWFALIFGFFLIIGSTLSGELSVMNEVGLNDYVIMLAVAFLTMIGPGAICLLFYYFHQLHFDDSIIKVRWWTGRWEEIKWEEIELMSFHHLLGYLKIIGPGKVLKLHQHLVGFSAFIKEMESQTHWNAQNLKLPFR